MHTPGPWRVEAVSDAVRVVVGQGRKKIILARLRPPQLPEDETWDNARLMAPAPDLLAALRHALEPLEAIARAGQVSHGGEQGGNLAHVEAVRDRIRQTIISVAARRGGIDDAHKRDDP